MSIDDYRHTVGCSTWIGHRCDCGAESASASCGTTSGTAIATSGMIIGSGVTVKLTTPSRRPTRDETGLALAKVWAERGTCARRKVGCVLMDVDGQVLSSGYNGPAAGQRHCTDRPCPGADAKPGTSLEICEAIHSEANALMRCQDVRLIHTCYVTHSPCLHCVKMLLGTGCQRIVFGEEYAHNEAARLLWMRTRYRKPPSPQVQEWVKL